PLRLSANWQISWYLSAVHSLRLRDNIPLRCLTLNAAWRVNRRPSHTSVKPRQSGNVLPDPLTVVGVPTPELLRWLLPCWHSLAALHGLGSTIRRQRKVKGCTSGL